MGSGSLHMDELVITQTRNVIRLERNVCHFAKYQLFIDSRVFAFLVIQDKNQVAP